MSCTSKWFRALAVTIPLLIFVALLLPMCSQVSYKSPIIVQLSHLKEVGLALQTYAENHGGNFPAHISDLPAGSIPDAMRQFHDPATNLKHDWLYFAGHKINDPERTIIAASTVETFHDRDVRAHAGGDRLVVFVNSAAQIMPEREFQQVLAAQRK